MNFGWSDIGSWDSYTKNLKSKKNKKVFQINSNSEVITSDKRIITTIDADDLIIVDTLDATLITKKDHQKELKN